MKKFLTILTICVLILTVAACVNNAGNTDNTGASNEQQSIDKTNDNNDTKESGTESNIPEDVNRVLGSWDLTAMRFNMGGQAFDMSMEDSEYVKTYVFDADGNHNIVSTEKASGTSSSDFSEEVIVTYTYENNTVTVTSTWDATIETMRAQLGEEAKGLSDEEVRAMFYQTLVYAVDFENGKLLLTTNDESGAPITYVLTPAV